MSSNNKRKIKIQISMEFIIIISLVAIVTLFVVAGYLSSVHNAKIGKFNDIISAYTFGRQGILILKLSAPLPAGAQIKSIDLTGIPSGRLISVLSVSKTPVYVNGYPAYGFLITGFKVGMKPLLSYCNVSSLTYEVNGETITVPTITGEPIAIENESFLYIYPPTPKSPPPHSGPITPPPRKLK